MDSLVPAPPTSIIPFPAVVHPLKKSLNRFPLSFPASGQYRIDIEARDGLGSGPHNDAATIVIEIQSINQHRPVFIMPALYNATVEIPEVRKHIQMPVARPVRGKYISFVLRHCIRMFFFCGCPHGTTHGAAQVRRVVCHCPGLCLIEFFIKILLKLSLKVLGRREARPNHPAPLRKVIIS